MVSENLPALEGHLDSALATGDLDRALALARRVDAGRHGGLDLDHALRLTGLMLALRHPRGTEAAERWHGRFRAERNPRRVEDEIAGAALRGLGEPEIAGFCERILRLTIGADTSP
ncbi:MAG TPA: hypothetical protein VMH33_04760 [Solirubrobacterales bacterium]|nr:hypothetical protein [Solirubrobacterales bacterium]